MAAPTSKTIYLLYAVGFLDLLGVSMIIPMLGRHARDIGASPTVVGILGSMYGFLQLFSSPVIGDWSDRSGRRQVLIWSLLLTALGYLLLSSASSVLMMFIARIPTGLFKHSQEVAVSYLGARIPKSDHARVFGRFQSASSMGFIVGPVLGGHLVDSPGGFGLVAMTTSIVFVANSGVFKHSQSLLKVALSDHLPKLMHAQAFGRYNAVSTLGFVVGPVIGGHLADLPHGFQLVTALTAAVFLVNAAIVWWFIPADVGSRSPQTSSGTNSPQTTPSIRSQLSLFVKNLRSIDWARLWDLFAARFLLGFAVIVYRSNFSLTLDARFQTTGKQIGYIISYASIIGTASGMIVGRIAGFYNNDRKLLLHCGVLQGASIALLTFSPSLWMLIAAMAPLSVANSIARVCVTNLTIARVRGDETGAVLGCGASVLSVARMMSPMLGGLAQEVHQTGPGLLGVASAAAGVVLLGTTGSGGEATGNGGETTGNVGGTKDKHQKQS